MEEMENAMGKRILLVDDEPNILTSLSFLLKKEHYNVATAANGMEAVAIFQSFRPDIILLDVMMPELDGFQTAAKIRALDTSSSTHIIFLTAKGTPNDKILGYMNGADDYVVKPFDNAMILEKLKEKAK